MVWLGLRVLLASCPIELRGRIVLVFSSTAHDSCIIILSEEFLHVKRDCKDMQEGKVPLKGKI